MATRTVIRVDATGKAHCLWTDVLALRALGRVTVRRASDVEFDAATGEWAAVETGTGAVIARDQSRQACLDAEREFFNAKLAGGA